MVTKNKKESSKKEFDILLKILLIIVGLILIYGGFKLLVSGITGNVVNEPIIDNHQIQVCNPNWQCSSWSECLSSGTKTRVCDDLNNCNILNGKPIESQSCTPLIVSKSWHKVTEINGKSDKVTDIFKIKGDKWKYIWSCDPDTTYGEGFDGISIFVYPEGETEMYVSSIFLASCNEGDENFVHEGEENYYFNVGTANLNGWSIVVEDYH